MAAVTGAVVAGLGSAYGAYSQSKAAKKGSKSTSYLEPYGGAKGTSYLNTLLDKGNDLYFNTPNPDIGPSDEMRRLYGELSGLVGGSGQNGGGGYSYTGGGSSGGGSSSSSGRPGGGNGNFMNTQQLGDYLGNYSVEPNQWMREVLDGKFLDQGNPYVQSLVDESYEDYQRSLGDIDSRFATSGRFGSGALARAHVLANEEFNEGAQQLRGSLYENERNRMMDAMGMLSGENTSARSTLGGTNQSLIARSGQLGSAKIAADAQRAAASMALRGQMARLGFDRDQAKFGNMMQLMGVAEGMNTLENKNELLPYEMLNQAQQFGLPILSTFGTQHGKSTQPYAGNPWINAGISGLGGYLGAGGTFGGGGS
jgi:hypothetical protein